jgi:hypothetical protein
MSEFDPQAQARFAEEAENFQAAGQAFVKEHPDFNQKMHAAAARGLTLDNKALRTIIRLRAPEVAYYLTDPKNEVEARNVMALSGPLQEVEVQRISNHLADVQAASRNRNRDKMASDDYIKMRIQERRSKYRR